MAWHVNGTRCSCAGFNGTILTVGLTFEKLLVILVIAVFIVGPDRLPVYAAKLAQLVKSLRQMASGAKERMREEMGPEFDEVDWQKLDPRQYDPRRIIRDALLEDDPPARTQESTASAASTATTVPAATAATSPQARAATPMGFDEEAT